MNRQLQKLAKKVKDSYYKHNQKLIVDTYEIRNENSCWLDVCLAIEGSFLFTIQNYNGFQDLDVVFNSNFKTKKIIEIWDGVRASFVPLYYDETITLKTFKPITEEQILQSTKYFVEKILGLWGIWNYELRKQEL